MDDLARRHARLFPLVHAQMQGWDRVKVDERLELFRGRLSEISWFMRCLSESIARRANREDEDGLPVSFRNYLALVQWAGQRLKAGKRGALSADLPASSRDLLNKLGLDPDRWLDAVQEFGRHFFTCAGSEERIRAFGRRRGIRLARGVCKARGFYTGVA